ncbi:tape-measure protein [Streptomyces sp. NPDC059096]|uniref:tape-measure protein n=1 Tax=Streptomyces sp. NPDC059096 TaxID=3346727 RepID=UPI0036B6A15C
MSAAAAGLGAGAGRDPLAGTGPALASFRSRLGEGGRALQALRQGVQRSATAAGRIASGATQATGGLRQVKGRAETAGQALTRVGRSAGSAGTQVRGGGGRAKGVAGALSSVATGAGLFGGLAGKLGSGAGTVSKIMGPLATGLTVATGAMTAVNVALRANPLGFVIGLITPIAAYLIELAVNSQTGQRIMKQVFDQALKVIQGIWTFLGPVVRLYAKTVSAAFTTVRTVIGGVLKAVGPALSQGFERVRSAVSTATRALTGLIRSAWNGLKSGVRPVLDWITRDIPRGFQRVKDALSRALNGMGGFVTSAMQALLSVVKGPLNGVISFANWVIGGLNKLSFSVLGKKFGVDLPKIPQLAEGGVVLPTGGGPHSGAVLPLSALDRLRPAEPGHGPSTGRPAHRAVLPCYHEPEGRSALVIAGDLLFLNRTAA